MTHRVIAQRLRGEGAGEFLDWDVPLEDLSVTDVISGPCQVTGTIPMAFRHIRGWDGLPVYSEWDTRLLVEDDGHFLGQGIIVHSGIKGEKISLDCAGFSYYPKGQPYEGEYSRIGIDTADVFREVWTYLQSRPNSALNVVVDPLMSGRTVGVAPTADSTSGGSDYNSGPLALNWFSTQDLGAVQDDMAKVGGFDYHEKSRWLVPDEEIEDRIQLGSPRIGRRRHDLAFTVGTNVISVPTLERNGENFATALLVLGAGEGREMVHALVDSGMSGRLRRVQVLSDKEIRTVEQASARGREELARRLILNDFTSLTVTDHPDARIGSWDVGDEVPIRVVTDWIDTVVWVRILTSTTRPADFESASLSVERVERLA